jgi:hypothetical protein
MAPVSHGPNDTSSFNNDSLVNASNNQLPVQVCNNDIPVNAGVLASQVPRAEEISIDARVLLFAVGIVVGAGDVIEYAGVGITGVGDHPYRASGVEDALVGTTGSADVIAAAASHAADGVTVSSDIHANGPYRTAMTAAGCGNIPAIQAGTLASRSTINIVNSTIAINGSQNQNNTGSGNLFNGWELGGKIDFNPTSKDRLSFAMNWNRIPDSFGFPNTTSNSNGRGPGFLNPTLAKSPNGQLSWVHTFSPTVLNEARVGYALNITGDVSTALPGVPDIRFDDGSMGFGARWYVTCA